MSEDVIFEDLSVVLNGTSSFIKENKKKPRRMTKTGFTILLLIRHLSNIVMKFNLVVNVDIFKCLECRKLPKEPYTCLCGHTVCSSCIISKGRCQCGRPPPTPISVNRMMEEIISQMQCICPRQPFHQLPASPTPTGKNQRRTILITQCRCVMMGSKNRMSYAYQLWLKKEYIESASHYLCVLMSSGTLAEKAQKKLTMVLRDALKVHTESEIIQQIFDMLKKLNKPTWSGVKNNMECIYCLECLKDPVTTPCGHTFCLACLAKSLDYGNGCPLCKSKLDMHYNQLKINIFVKYIITTLRIKRPLAVTTSSNNMPIIECTLAMPKIACHMILLDPKYYSTIRCILKNENKHFGMVMPGYSHQGTICILRSCVQQKSGSFIITIEGVKRFRIINEYCIDWIQMAEVEEMCDIVHRPDVRNIREIMKMIYEQGLWWFGRQSDEVRSDIIYSFGKMPSIDLENPWNERNGCPDWVWWLLSVMPISMRAKAMAHSTNDLLMRLSFMNCWLQ